MNTNLNKARSNKNDEFYTLLEDIEKEMAHYVNHFKDKVVYCNCDNPRYSNFWKYFHVNFAKLRLKKLIATYYNENGPSCMYEYRGGDDSDLTKWSITNLDGNGDFRSDECVELLKRADIVVTNPPFSLFRDFIDIIMQHKKDFIVIGNQNAITYNNIFHNIVKGKIVLGINHIKKFMQPDGSIKKFGNVVWFTTLCSIRNGIPLNLCKNYYGNESSYKTYDNYNAINVDKTLDIPNDYKGIIGVPISFLDHYCTEQFEIVGKIDTGKIDEYNLANPIINGKPIYKRIAIRRKQ